MRFWTTLFHFIFFFLVLTLNSAERLGLVSVFAFGFYSFIDLVKSREFKYIHMWNFSFVYIISTEIILSSSKLELTIPNGLEAVRIAMVSNYLVLFGYWVFKKYEGTILDVPELSFTKRNSIFFLVLVLAGIVYFALRMPVALRAFREGRAIVMEENVRTTLSGAFISAVGYTLPAFLAYYFRFVARKKLVFILITLLSLIIIPQFLYGTRFALLFSVVGFGVVWYYRNISKRTLILLVILSMGLSLTMNYVKSIRNVVGEKNISLFSVSENSSFLQRLASFGSSEGVVEGTGEMIKYLQSHDYLYGESSSFIFYFWIPRDWWPEKPRQISYWLVREYAEVYSEIHSGGYGFWGELFMDFGYPGLLILFFVGMFIRKVEFNKNREFKRLSPFMPLYALYFPFFFLTVRSPQTSITTWIFICIIVLVLKRVFQYSFIENIAKEDKVGEIIRLRLPSMQKVKSLRFKRQ